MAKDSRQIESGLFPRKVVPVLLPMPAERAYSYALPDGADAVPGQIVQVPLGPRLVAGVVWDGEADVVNPDKLREITQVFDCPPLNAPMRRFIDWVAAYTLSPPGLVARMALQGACRLRSRAADRGAAGSPMQRPERLTAARERVLAQAADGLAWTKSGLAHAAGVSPA
jgi:primosomal protein N' (replication factor Y)